MKKIIAAFIFFVLCTNPAAAAWTHVQSNNTQNGTGTTSTTWTLTLSAMAANSLVSGEFLWDIAPGATVVSIKTDKGDTAVIPDTNNDPGNEDGVSYYFAGVTAGATVITVTLSTAAGFTAMSADEDSPGAGFVPSLDGHNTNTQPGLAAGTNNITTGSFSTAANGDIIKGFTMNSGGQGTFSAGTSPNAFTARNNFLGGAGQFSILSEDFIQTTAGSINPTITVSATFGGNINVISFGLAAKAVPSGGGGGGTRRSLTGVGN